MRIATKNKLVFLSLLALFMLPMLAAGIMFYTGRGIPVQTINHGDLLQPPLPFAKLALQDPQTKLSLAPTKLVGKWLLVYINPQSCAQSCLETLYKIRQTRTALGKNRDRLTRVFISYQKLSSSNQQQLNTIYSGTEHFLTTPSTLITFLDNTSQHAETLQQGRLYLVDPLGNTLQSYPLDIPFKSLLGDLNRLLQISQIG